MILSYNGTEYKFAWKAKRPVAADAEQCAGDADVIAATQDVTYLAAGTSLIIKTAAGQRHELDMQFVSTPAIAVGPYMLMFNSKRGMFIRAADTIIQRSLAPLPYEARGFAITHDRSRQIWAFGGSGGSPPAILDTVARFDIATDTWTIANTRMPTARVHAAAVAMYGTIYVIGGIAADGTPAPVESLNPDTLEWKTLAPTPLKGISNAVACDGYIYVAGRINRQIGILGMVAHKADYAIAMFNPRSHVWRVCINVPACGPTAHLWRTAQ